MAKKTKVLGVTTTRGKQMKTGKGWKLLTPTGKTFKAVLVRRLKIGDENVAVFRVLPMPGD